MSRERRGERGSDATVLGWWGAGTLGCWDTGTMGCRHVGILGWRMCWIIKVLDSTIPPRRGMNGKVFGTQGW